MSEILPKPQKPGVDGHGSRSFVPHEHRGGCFNPLRVVDFVAFVPPVAFAAQGLLYLISRLENLPTPISKEDTIATGLLCVASIAWAGLRSRLVGEPRVIEGTWSDPGSSEPADD